MIYPQSQSLPVNKQPPFDPETFLDGEGCTYIKTFQHNGASWYVYQDAEGKLWKMPSFQSPVFLTPYINEG